MAEVEVVIDNMESGFSTDAGFSSSGEVGYSTGKNGSVWSDLSGLFPREGGLRFAFDGGDAFTSGLTIQGNSTSATISNAQRAVRMFRRGATSVTRPEVLVTTREIFVDGVTAYGAMNPTYTTGTVDTDGAGNVTGTGTAWVLARIQPGMVIQFAGADTNWYTIATVAATALTLTANGPNVAAGTAYTIRRCFGGNASVQPSSALTTSKNRIFAEIVNGDLYVGGSQVIGDCPGIVKVTNIFNNPNSSIPYAVTSIILSPYTLNSTVATKSVITGLLDIVGMKVLPDGRILIATHETSSNNYIYNRVRTNSLTDPAEWNDLSQIYFADILGFASESTGLGRIGEAFTLHFGDGIAIGNPTGQQDPPLTWATSRATRGALCPELLGNFPGGDFFLGQDLRPYVFDGSTERPIGDFSIQKCIQSPSFLGTVVFSEAACGYDNITSSFHFFLNKWATGTTTGMGCTHFMVREQSNQMFRSEWPSVIGGISSSVAYPAGTSRIYIGRASANQSTTATLPSTTYNIVGYFQYEQWAGNEAAPGYAAVPALTTALRPEHDIHAVSHWIDFGYPTKLKTLKKIEIWGRAAGGFQTGDIPAPPTEDSIKVLVESRPLAASGETPTGFSFAAPAEYITALKRSKPFDGDANWVPMVLDELNFARIFIDPEPQTSPPTQSSCATHFRIGLWSVEGGLVYPSYSLRGIWKVRIVAELGGEPVAVDMA